MPDWTISDWDTATKSTPGTPDGNFEIESNIDNPSIAVGDFELGNIKGDRFNTDDANAITWKWKDTIVFSGSDDSEIASGQFRALGPTGSNFFIHQIRNQMDGDMSIQIKTIPTSVATGATYSVLAVHEVLGFGNEPGQDGFWMQRLGVLQASAIVVWDIINGVQTQKVSINDITGTQWLRIVRTGDVWSLEYSSDDISYTVAYSATLTHPSLLYPLTIHRISLDTQEWNTDDYKVNSGNFNSAGTSYRASGNIENISDPVIVPDGKKMFETILTTAGLTAGRFIDRIEWLVGGVVKATHETNITSGSSTTIVEADLTSGTFNDVNADCTLRFFVVGDDDGSPSVSVSGNFTDIIASRGGNPFDF